MSNFRQMPPMAILAESPSRLGLRVSMVQIAVFADLIPRLNTLGITSPSRMTALLHIAATPGCSQTDLAVYTGLSRASAMTMADQLENAGFIERRGGKDARANALFLTPAGASILVEAKRQSAINESRLFDVLSEDERTTLKTLLERVIANAATLGNESQIPKNKNGNSAVIPLNKQ